MSEIQQQASNEELIRKMTQIILENLNDEQFGVSELAEQIGMNRSHLYRKVLALTKKSLSQFIREIRLSEGLKILKEEEVTVSEAAYRVGFSNPSYFNSCFHDLYGFPPGEAKNVKLGDRILDRKREKSSDNRRIILVKKFAYVTVFLFFVIITISTVGFLNRDKNVIEDKSIAVLPFTSLGDDPEMQYQADGVMEDILLHLARIEELRVMSSTSVQQYRNNTDKTATEICQELGVSYLMEGRFQKIDDKARLIVQLIQPGIEGYIWVNDYNREWKDVFAVQSEVAQLVAKELQAVITPKEQQLIEKIPTTDLTAYDFYQRGREQFNKYRFDHYHLDALESAENFFYRALEYDSTYALAFIGLAHIYYYKYFRETYFTENYMDSMLILADLALSYDDQLAEAYVTRGSYYSANSNRDQAIIEFDKAIEFNPNYWEAYWRMGQEYFNVDFVKALDNYRKAALLYRGPFLPDIFERIRAVYSHYGFNEKAIYYAKEVLKLDGDSAAFYMSLAAKEDSKFDFEKANEFYEKSYAFDSTRLFAIALIAQNHLYLDQFAESLKYFIEYETNMKTLDIPIVFSMKSLKIGYAYWVNERKDEAEYYFNGSKEYFEKMNELNRVHKRSHLFEPASYYAFKGDKDKAFEYLDSFTQKVTMTKVVVKNIKYSPLFDNIRDEPEFQQIVRDVEAKYQAEHERVKQWLEENDML